MESGIRLANEILDSGRALEKLREFQRFFAV
jgi:anthranilate phosphoribosyltransferase